MNIINAIMNLINNPITQIVETYKNHNRANNEGDSLEEYIKDLFSDSFNLNNNDRLKKISNTFSYLGNNSNPPDAMLLGGDAIEIKKIESFNSSLALNSSYPKQKITSDSNMISMACRKSEAWDIKDIIYIVGVVDKNDLKHLCMVYGTEYCATNDCYERIKTTIKTGVESVAGVEFSETNELGRVNKIDPLGITYMRVRGMWGIENPWKVFDYVYKRDFTKKFNFMCIINKEKWNSFENRHELEKLAKINSDLSITNVEIKDPDNPAKLKQAKLISFYLK